MPPIGSGRKIRLLIVRHGETDYNVQGIIQGQLDTDLNAVGLRQAQFVAQVLAKEHIDEVYSSPLRRAKDTADAIVDAHPLCKSTKGSYWVDDRLKERGFGSLEGKTFDRSKPKRDSIDGIEQMNTFTARLGSFLADLLSRPAPFSSSESNGGDAEWVDEAVTRPTTVTESMVTAKANGHSPTTLEKAGSERTILIVAHGAAISALVGTILLDMQLATVAAGIQRTRIWNCSITEVTVQMDRIPFIKGKADLKSLAKDDTRKAFIIERWADVRHLPDEIDDAAASRGNADEMVGRAAS